jgi:hypothetical protein
MKKFCLSVLAIAGLVSASFVYANNAYLAGYSTTLSPPTSSRLAKASLTNSFQTDIKVINATNEYFSLVLPNTSIRNDVPPHAPNNDHIHNLASGHTSLILTNPMGVAFNLNDICPQAVITVYGFYNGGLTIDSQDCYN